MTTFLADMHTHTHHSHDSSCPLADMAMAQMRQGVSVFAVTEHCDCMLYETESDLAHIKASAEEVLQTKPQWDGKIEILYGIEMGDAYLAPHIQEYALSLCDYDIIIGSAHYIYNPTGFQCGGANGDYSKISTDALYDHLCAYFTCVKNVLKSTPCSTLAHLTYPLRYINGKYGRNIDFRRFTPDVEDVLSYLVSHNIALEVNTSNIGTDFHELAPPEWIVSIYREMGGKLLTLGSDAHSANRAAVGFYEATQMLKKLGYTEYHYYKNRKPIACNL